MCSGKTFIFISDTNQVWWHSKVTTKWINPQKTGMASCLLTKAIWRWTEVMVRYCFGTNQWRWLLYYGGRIETTQALGWSGSHVGWRHRVSCFIESPVSPAWYARPDALWALLSLYWQQDKNTHDNFPRHQCTCSARKVTIQGPNWCNLDALTSTKVQTWFELTTVGIANKQAALSCNCWWSKGCHDWRRVEDMQGRSWEKKTMPNGMSVGIRAEDSHASTDNCTDSSTEILGESNVYSAQFSTTMI